MTKKYGLVLEGGGAKGSYHIGAYRALTECGFKFDAVVGTSIGAINGAFIACGEVDKCEYIWRNKNLGDFSENEGGFVMPHITDDMDLLTKIKELGKVMFKGTIPLTPLKELVYGTLEEEKIRNSKTKYGLVTVNVTDKKGEEVFTEDIKEGELLDYIIGSSYLPFFKMETLHGKYYLDGGFYNNIPYEMVQKLHLTPVIIRVNPKDYHNYSFPENAIVIGPKQKLNKTLNFSTKVAENLIKLGYFDALKVINNLLGDEYYFNKITEKKALQIFEKKVFAQFELNQENYLYKSPYRILFEEYLPKIASTLELKANYTTTDVLVGLIENKLKKENVDRFEILNIEDIVSEMKEEDFFIPESKGIIRRTYEQLRGINEEN